MKMDVFFFVCFVMFSLKNVVTAHEQCRASPFVINPDARARFTVISSIRTSIGNNECGAITKNVLRTLSTIQWAVQKINSANYIPVLQLGFDVYDDCGLEKYSAFSALDSASARFPARLMSCSGNDTRGHFDLGILGTTRSQTTNNVLNMLRGTNVPVISPFASLPALTDFPNFFRTTPADDDQVKVIVQLIKELGWTYVAALHTDDNYGSHGMSQILKLAKVQGICIDVVQSISTQEGFAQQSVLENFMLNLTAQKQLATNQKLGIIYFGQKYVIEQLLIRINQLWDSYKGFHWIMSDFVGTSLEVFTDADKVSDGTLTISTSSVYIEEAHNYFVEKWNSVVQNKVKNKDPIDDLIKEYLESPKSDSTADWQNDSIMQVVDAVYVIATALKEVFIKKCFQYRVVCNGFEEYLLKNMLQVIKGAFVNYGSLNTTSAPAELVKINRIVQFDSVGNIMPDVSSPLYDVNLYSVANKAFSKIGEFKNNTLKLNSTSLSLLHVLSSCASHCPNCITTPPLPYHYLDGDPLFMGIFSVHDPVDGNAFMCGKFRNYTNDVIGVEAFFHAVAAMRNATGINFGAIAFDDCYSHATGSLILSQFLSGTVKLESGIAGKYVDPKKVVVVIGPYSSGVAVPSNFLFTLLNLPSICYSASSPDLDDKTNFPFFLRTVPSDVTQVDAMIAIIQKIGWETVGMLYVDNNYGSKGKDLFIAKAKAQGICVTNPIILSEASSDDVNAISLAIGQEYKEEVFVYFGTETRMIDLLKSMSKRVNDNNIQYNFVFIGSDAWGASAEIKQKLGEVAEGSLTFTFESYSAADSPKFESYIRTKTPTVQKYNSWFREFWRDHFKCDPIGDYDKRYGKTCADDIGFSDTDIDEFHNDQRLQHIMNAVYAAGYGFKNLSETQCSNRKLTDCKILKETPSLVHTAIKGVSLKVNGNDRKVFDSDGNGNIGFNIMNLQRYLTSSNTYQYEYKKVGYYGNNTIVLEKSKISSKTVQRSAKCGSNCACQTAEETTSAQTTTVPVVTVTEDPAMRSSDIIIIAIAGSTCFLVIIILFVVICCFCKKGDPTKEVYSKAYYKNEIMNRNQQVVSAGNIKLINPQGGDCKDAGGFINRAFSGSEAYLHPSSTSNSETAIKQVDYPPPPPPPPPESRNHMIHTPPDASPTMEQPNPNGSPVKHRHRRKGNTPSSSPRGEITNSPFPSPTSGTPSPTSAFPRNLKQYQVTNGYPRMGTNVGNGSPTTIQNSLVSDFNPLFMNQGNDLDVDAIELQNPPISPEGNGFDRRSQFASLKKKQKRIYSEASLNSTQSVEKISRV